MSGENQFDGKKFADDLRDETHRAINANLRSRTRAVRRSNGLVPGVILVVIGTLFLLDHMGILRVDSVWKFWPLAIVAVGCLKLAQPGERALGIGFIVVGALVQAHQLGFIAAFSWGTAWPFILIFAGVSLIWSRFEARKSPGLQGSISSGTTGGDTVNEYALFGGVERRVTVNNFRGGNVTAIFGGIELDFRGADIDGGEAVIYVEAVCGGIEITVPERWNVAFQVQSVFGGYSDETRASLPDVVGAAPRKTLLLHGRAVFGGISVKN